MADGRSGDPRDRSSVLLSSAMLLSVVRPPEAPQVRQGRPDISTDALKSAVCSSPSLVLATLNLVMGGSVTRPPTEVSGLSGRQEFRNRTNRHDPGPLPGGPRGRRP